ncbi:MAG: PTS sugar transporter subunit IIB [Clostridiaceae bacterium]
MVNIMLFCGAGISSGILARRMRDAAGEMQLDLSIEAYPESNFKKYLDNADIVLVGPQSKFMFEKFKDVCDERAIPSAVINNVDYGMMKAENVIRTALKIIKDKKNLNK